MTSSTTNPVRALVAFSLATNALAVAWLVWPVDQGSIDIKAVLTGVLNNLPKVLFLTFLTIGSWLISFGNASSDRYRPSSGVFAILSTISCAVFFFLAPTAPTEALGYHLLIYFPVPWVLFFFSMLFKDDIDSRQAESRMERPDQD
jgi:hypothetical protein